MQDAWRAYLELALGLTEASRKKAVQVVRSLAEQSGTKVQDLQGMVDELLSTAVANRENVVKLIQFEMDKTLGKVGLATTEEVAELKTRVRHLEEELKEARQRADAAEPSEAKPAKKTAKKAAAKKTTAKKTTAKKTTAKKTTKKAVKKTASKTAKKATRGE